jgi:hypothetical protein
MLGLLARGPITLSGHYFGIHFLALACALTLVGFNLVHYGIMAKVVGLRSVTHVNSRIARWAMSHYSLERTLLVATLLVLAGLGCDAWLLVKWLTAPGLPMDSTVHAVFIATLAIVIGVNLALGAFLLNMLIDEAKH